VLIQPPPSIMRPQILYVAPQLQLLSGAFRLPQALSQSL